MRKTILNALALAAMAAAPVCSAMDITVPTKITDVEQASVGRFKFVGKPSGTFPLPPGTDDPTVNGGSLAFTDTSVTGGGGTFALPASGWKGLGIPPGARGFKYRGAGSPSDPCKVVIIRSQVIKALCRSAGGFVGPVAGTLAMTLRSGSGTRYCAECGGTVQKNEPGRFRSKDCAAPVSCFGSPSGAFLSGPAF